MTKKYVRRTTESFKKEVEDLTNGEIELIGEFKNKKTKTKFKHNCDYCENYIWETTPENFLKPIEKECKCPICNGTIKPLFIIKKDIKKIVGNEYIILSNECKGTHDVVTFRHNCDRCNNHEFTTTPGHFLYNNTRCPECARLDKMYDTLQFKELVYEKVGDEYTVLGEYTGTDNKILMRHNCDKCNNNEYEVTPNSFLNSDCRCPECFGTKQKTHEEFIDEIYEKVGGEYTVLGEYLNAQQGNIKMRHNCDKCNNHEWDANIQHFLAGSRCPECAKLNKKLEYDYVKNEIYRLGLGEYELKSKEYIDSKTKLDIYHKKCGCISKICWNDFQQGTRCKCSKSKGNIFINKYLTDKEIQFIDEKKFNDCKFINNLSFDFYIPHLNLLIEYDGEQHFSYIEYFHKNYSGFELDLKCDQIKNQWCKDNKVNLIRISYKDFNNLEKILDDIFDSNKKLHPKQYNSVYIYLPEKELLLETGIYKTLPKIELLNE